MNQHRGPLLLILCAVMVVIGGYASPIHKSTGLDDFALHSAYTGYSVGDNWLGGTGDWSNPAGWGGGLPGIGSDVYINTGADLVYLDTNATIASLTLGGTTGSSQLSSTGTTHYLIIAGALTVNQTGILSLDSSDTVAAATLAVNSGTINLNGGSALQIYGDASNLGSISLGSSSGGNSLTVNGMLTNQGSLALNASDTANVGNLVNGGTIDVENASTLHINGNASNSGSISLGSNFGGNSLTVNGALTNQGSLALSSASDNANIGSLVNLGSIDIENGSALEVGDAYNSGHIFFGYGSSIGFGNLENAGTIGSDFASGLHIGGTLTNDTSGQIAFWGYFGGLTVQGDVNNAGLIEEGPGGSQWYIGGTLNNSGSFLPGPNDSIVIGSIRNSGTFRSRGGGTLQVNGDVNNSGQFFTTSGGEVLNIVGTLYNSGSFTWTDSGGTIGSVVNSGSIDLEAGTTLQVNGEGNNSGYMLLNFNEGGLGSQAQFGSLVNSGFIDVRETSNLTVVGNMNNTAAGGVSLSTWDQLSVGCSLTNGGNITAWAAQIGIAGDLANNGGIGLSNDAELVVNGDAINSGTIQIFGGDEIHNPSHASFGSLVNSGTIQIGYGAGFGAGTLTNTGRILGDYPTVGGISAGNLNNSGLIALGGLDAGNVNNSGSIQLDYAEISGNFTNSGDFSLFSYNEGTPGILGVHGNLTNSGQFTADGSIGSTTVNIGGRLFNTPTGTVLINGSLNVFNAGSVVNQGTLTLDSANTFTVTGGPHAAASALSGFLNTGLVNIAQNSNLNVVGNYTQLAGRTTINGTLQVQGRGVAIFAGGSLYSEEGTISGPVFSNAAINIGDQLMSLGGPLTFLGNYTQGPNGSLTFDIAGTAPGEFDQLNISGQARLNGLMTVDLIHGFVPDLGDTFDIMRFAGESGRFSMVLGLPINGEEHFVPEYNAADLTLDVVAGALLGADSGGTTLMASNLANDIASSIVSSDASGSTALSGQSSPTPEPGSLLLLGSGLMCVGYSVRRRMTK
jgi:hypothetical protein